MNNNIVRQILKRNMQGVCRKQAYYLNSIGKK